MDDADIAAEQEFAMRAEALRVVQAKPQLKACGRCYNCGEDCWGLFCDESCRRDYDRRATVATKTRTKFDCDPFGDEKAFDRSPVRETSRSEPRGEYDAQTWRRL